MEISNYPWIYSKAMGWFYYQSDQSSENTSWAWIHSQNKWFYFNQDSEGYIWSSSDNAWFYYHEDSEGEGWLYDFTKASWERIIPIIESAFSRVTRDLIDDGTYIINNQEGNSFPEFDGDYSGFWGFPPASE